jgi:DNA gyrase/topoisomerase IV subunit A
MADDAYPPHSLNRIPDVRDGLTRLERVILWVLHEAQNDFGDRRVPTATIYGRVVEHVNVSVDEFQRTLARLTGRGGL